MTHKLMASSAISQITYDAILSAVDFAIPIAEMYANITTNVSWDNAAVLFVKKIRANEVIMKWVHDVFCDPVVVSSSGDERVEAIHAAMEASAPAGGPIRALLEKLGFVWTMVKDYMPSFITLLLSVLGGRL